MFRYAASIIRSGMNAQSVLDIFMITYSMFCIILFKYPIDRSCAISKVLIPRNEIRVFLDVLTVKCKIVIGRSAYDTWRFISKCCYSSHDTNEYHRHDKKMSYFFYGLSFPESFFS